MTSLLSINNGLVGASSAQTVVTSQNVTAPLSSLRADLRNGYVFELVRLRAPRPERVVVLPLNPTRYDITEPHASVLTPGSGGFVVDESNGVVMRELAIEGTFGVKERATAGIPGFGSDSRAKSGNEHFRDLRNLFRSYDEMRKDPQFGPDVKLVFHSLRDDDHWILAKPTFSTPRNSKQNRVHYSYRISAVIIGKADSISRMKTGLTVPDDTFRFSDALRDVGEAFNDARAAFTNLTQVFETAKRKVGNLQALMLSVSGFVNAVGNAVRQGGRLVIDYPFRLVASLANTVGDAADSLAEGFLDGTVGAAADAERSLREIENAIDRIAMFPDHFVRESGSDIARRYLGDRALTANDIADGTAGAGPGSRIAMTLGSASRSGLDLEETGSVTSVRVTKTTTLESVASLYGTSPEAIIVQNNLTPPYFAPGGGPGLLAPGDTLLVPIQPSDVGPPVAPNPVFDDPDEAIYGVDMALDPVALKDGYLDVAVDTVHGAKDAALARGVQNLINGIEITLHTERGTTAYLPALGIVRNIGRPGTVEQVILASVALRDALLSDSRITGILFQSIVLDGDRLVQQVTPSIIGKQSGVPLALPFGTAQGD